MSEPLKFIIVDYRKHHICTSDTNVVRDSTPYRYALLYSSTQYQIALADLVQSYAQLHTPDLGLTPNADEWVFELPHNELADLELSARIDAFKKDIHEVCTKHQLYISHEDRGGCFLITEYDTTAWFDAASFE